MGAIRGWRDTPCKGWETYKLFSPALQISHNAWAPNREPTRSFNTHLLVLVANLFSEVPEVMPYHLHGNTRVLGFNVQFIKGHGVAKCRSTPHELQRIVSVCLFEEDVEVGGMSAVLLIELVIAVDDAAVLKLKIIRGQL